MATEVHPPKGVGEGVHDAPELVEVQTVEPLTELPRPPANRVPSAEDASAIQLAIGALVCLQVRPESEDAKIGPEPENKTKS